MPRRILLLALAAVAVVLLGGCRVDTTVEVRVEGRGGAVTARFRLDREAVAVLGGAVVVGAQTSDLHRAGWVISPVGEIPGGGAEVEVSKAFHRPEDLGAVVEELAGPDGLLRDFRLDRRRSLGRTTYRVSGAAGGGPDEAVATAFANSPDLPARLRDAGVDPARVEELLRERAAGGLGVRLVVALPGREESWPVEAGAPQPIDLSSSVTDRVRPALLVVAVVSGLAALFRLRRRTPQT